MKIVVCVKQVPDTWSEKKLDPATKTLDRESVDGVMNELDEYAVEEALKIAEATSGEVTVLSISKDGVRLGIKAPRDVQIHRREVFEAIAEANRAASAQGRQPLQDAAALLRSRLPKGTPGGGR